MTFLKFIKSWSSIHICSISCKDIEADKKTELIYTEYNLDQTANS